MSTLSPDISCSPFMHISLGTPRLLLTLMPLRFRRLFSARVTASRWTGFTQVRT